MRITFGPPDPWDQFAEPNLRVIQFNDQGGHGYTRAWMCPFCSALVLDGPAHERWHIAIITAQLSPPADPAAGGAPGDGADLESELRDLLTQWFAEDVTYANREYVAENLAIDILTVIEDHNRAERTHDGIKRDKAIRPRGDT